ncbi:PH domain-containing protein [Streptomyces glaucus]|uniref:PH domain-containing protein n=1 Tax=Streptomyces glaucus TaxID=284029 RepID=A0ABN3JQ01_9ACTN
MTSPEHQSPAPQPSEPESAGYREQVHRSSGGIAGGVLLLAVIGWLGIDAVATGEGRTPWLALAALLFLVPLVVAFTLRPAVLVSEDRLRVRNPFRMIVLPWGQIAALRSGYSHEVVTRSGAKYQLWALPVSLRARKKAARRAARAAAEGAPETTGRSGPGRGGLLHRGGAGDGPVRAETDKIMDDLRALLEDRGEARTAQGEVTVRWAYEVAAPAAAGAVLLAVLLAVG